MTDAPLPLLPDAPALIAGFGRVTLLLPDGEIATLPTSAVGARLRELAPPLVVHAPNVRRRLGAARLQMFDLLELFAFVCPAQSAAPTPRGLALALGLDAPTTPENAAVLLPEIALHLLQRLGRDTARHRREAAGVAALMGRAGWNWAPFVLTALGAPPDLAPHLDALRVWKRLPEWDEAGPPVPPASHPVSSVDARARLAELLGSASEQRPGQADYASAVTAAFAPRESQGAPHVVLAEAGTGTGKTLGYIAPASLWAERNKAPVWIATYTKHLQRQVQAELVRLEPDAARRRRRVVIRKGRENYLCLLNLEDVVGNVGMQGAAVPLGLIARWALATEDGDLQGGDLPGWFAELFDNALLASLADRRGECIHSTCPHWRRCFVEHTVRRAQHADLVVANHALVMAQAAWGGIDDASVPTRYVFDEGHQLFDAADSAFSVELSGLETAELRRWLLGAEGGRSRARGLKRRMEEITANRPELLTPLEAALQAARSLPGAGWQARLLDSRPDLMGDDPVIDNPTEAFLAASYHQVLGRAAENDSNPSLECDLYPVSSDLTDAGETLRRALARLAAPIATLEKRLADRLEDEAEELDSATRQRLESAVRSLKRRVREPLSAWESMLRTLSEDQPPPGTRPDHVMWLALERREGRVMDVGLHRHWLDPTVPFVATLAAPAHGMLITSATLRDTMEDAEAAWHVAEERTGAVHLPAPAIRAVVTSPFDYARQTRCFVINDLRSEEIGQLAAAYRELFKAAGGGALGLFTAISRLRAVYARIAPDLEAAGIPLYAQHVDVMDNATLVDVFRTEPDSCLLGTDAMRDGVDVPGSSLRLVVFEKIPWARPTILHRERRAHLSGGRPGAYDDAEVRRRLRQAFGRLIRRADDRGVFILLDRRAPSRLLDAFPEGVAVTRLGMADAIAETRAFLAD